MKTPIVSLEVDLSAVHRLMAGDVSRSFANYTGEMTVYVVEHDNGRDIVTTFVISEDARHLLLRVTDEQEGVLVR